MFAYLPIRSNNSPPAAYSRKMYSIDPCVRLPKNLRIFGCERIFWMQTSFLTDDSASGCFSKSIIFIATASPDWRFMSSFTLCNLEEWRKERQRDGGIRRKLAFNLKDANNLTVAKKYFVSEHYTHSPYAPSPKVWAKFQFSTNSRLLLLLCDDI